MLSKVSANPELVFLVRGLEQLGPGLSPLAGLVDRNLPSVRHHFILSRSFREFLVEVAGQEVAQ